VKFYCSKTLQQRGKTGKENENTAGQGYQNSIWE
jgi:hypothetical protein